MRWCRTRLLIFFFTTNNNICFNRTTVHSFPDLSHELAKLFTKVKVAALVFGLEEASPGLGVNVSSLLHQQLHVLLTAPLYSNVQRRLP